MTILYTAIGNTRAPAAALDLCREVGRELAARGLTLRTTDRAGCDEAFADGALSVASAIVEPAGVAPHQRSKYVAPPDAPAWALSVAARALGPASWLKLAETTRQVHGRVLTSLLGRDGRSPSRFVLFWARTDPRAQDGTRVVARVADDPPSAPEPIPWLNLKGLTLADALAFAHQHAGVPVLRPGDVLPYRLIPSGALFVGLAYPAGEYHVLLGDDGQRVAVGLDDDWLGFAALGMRNTYDRGEYGGNASNPFDCEIVALGLTRETATAENLQRLAREHEERKRA